MSGLVRYISVLLVTDLKYMMMIHDDDEMIAKTITVNSFCFLSM